MKSNNSVYDNCKIFAPDGELLGHCQRKKADWYLNQNLATKISDDPLTVQLNFEPSARNFGGGYNLQPTPNLCFVCGSTEELTRHHCIPHQYRKYFPLEIKKSNSHDIICLCITCHVICEQKSLAFKRKIAKDFNVPIHGIRYINRDLIFAVKAANALINYKDKIPAERVHKLEQTVCKFLNKDNYTTEDLHNIEKRKKEKTITVRTHGEVVVEQINDFGDFMRSWRENFVKTMNPQYLPDNWSIDYVTSEI